MDTFATELRAAMDRRRHGQKELAAHFGIEQSTASRWIAGVGLPRSERVNELADYLGATPAEVALLIATSRRKQPDFREILDRLEQLEERVAELLAKEAGRSSTE